MQKHHKGFLCRLQYSVGELESRQELSTLKCQVVMMGKRDPECLFFSWIDSGPGFYSSRHQFMNKNLLVPRDSPTLAPRVPGKCAIFSITSKAGAALRY